MTFTLFAMVFKIYGQCNTVNYNTEAQTVIGLQYAKCYVI